MIDAPTRPEGRILWLDAARIAAIIAVIAIHVVSGTAVGDVPVTPTARGIALVVLASVTWCVPLFVMISGALLLDPRGRTDARAFYRRRLGRLLIAGLFWSLVYWAWRVHFHGEHVPPDEFIRSVLVAKPYAHLHFLFVIIGLYLVTPLLWAFVATASRTRLRLAVVLALAIAAIHQALGLVEVTVPRTLVTHFLPYVGYFLAGFLLRDARLDRGQSILALGLFAAAVVLGVVGSTVLRSTFGPDEANTALGYFSVTTIVTTIVVFLLFRTWLGPERMGTRAVPGWIGPVAAATFGVYLVHPIVLDLWRTVVPIGAGRFAPILVFPLSVAVVGLVTLAVVLVARQVPVVRRVVP